MWGFMSGAVSMTPGPLPAENSACPGKMVLETVCAIRQERFPVSRPFHSIDPFTPDGCPIKNQMIFTLMIDKIK
jgi:hypothetical protein